MSIMYAQLLLNFTDTIALPKFQPKLPDVRFKSSGRMKNIDFNWSETVVTEWHQFCFLLFELEFIDLTNFF